MARITGAADERIYTIQRWLGLHENPDGDTKLKLGEAAEMRNFRVTRDGNLQKRPGTKAVLAVSEGDEIEAVWAGNVSGTEHVCAVCAGQLWDVDLEGETATAVGSLGTTDRPCLFGFADRLYILTGSAYYRWDGTTLAEVDGYIPLVAVAVTPSGGGELLEQVNKLTPKRKCWLSPDGEAVTFQLPEKGIRSVDSVTLTSDGSAVTGWTADEAAGTVTFGSAPTAGTSTLEVAWTASADDRGRVLGMHFAEFYNGSQDTRVFLYGDGSSDALYSDIDNLGQANAEYFPDLNVVRIGVENTPITALIRHYGRLLAFKSDCAYSVDYGSITLADGNQTAAFYVTPINRSIGCEAPGQAQLMLNNPVTLFGQDLYEWRSASFGNLTRDERQARRISDRIYATLHGFDTKQCVCYDNNYEQELYICDPGGTSLVLNYAADAWTTYTDFTMHRPFSWRNRLFYGGTDGRIYEVSYRYRFDEVFTDGVAAQRPIDCYWESGAMSFGRDYQRKNSAMLWLGFKPEAKSQIDVSILTDRDSGYNLAKKNPKSLSYQLFDFEHIDFADFDFATSDKPQLRRLKLKAKKFVYYKLILKTKTNNSSVTVTAADIRVRFMGYAKG